MSLNAKLDQSLELRLRDSLLDQDRKWEDRLRDQDRKWEDRLRDQDRKCDREWEDRLREQDRKWEDRLRDQDREWEGQIQALPKDLNASWEDRLHVSSASCSWEGKLEDGKESADCKRIQDVDEWAKKVKELTHSHDES